MSDGEDEECQAYFAVNTAKRRVREWTNPMDESRNSTDDGKKCENGKRPSDWRCLFTQLLEPCFPTKMQV